MVRTIQAEQITQEVAQMCKEAAYYLPGDVFAALERGRLSEKSPVGREVLEQIITNAKIALFERKNTQDNTPAVIYTEIVPGDKLTIQVEPKGFGSENKSGLKMLVPADGVKGVKKAVMDIILHASCNPCPPMVVGIGIGGTMDRAAVMSKKALLRPTNVRNAHPEYAKLEEELLELINQTGIGPQLGGTTSALAVNIEWGPTHIAGLPVAVTICCHACRHSKRVL